MASLIISNREMGRNKVEAEMERAIRTDPYLAMKLPRWIWTSPFLSAWATSGLLEG